ncbi:hypothetical protein R9X47_11385 [Wukongibacter baidiensis]|uniref:hypothetical protein n=1 Tax=Wukongibacter baidiensis TaxID=1723361 RepID=UPI003D7F68C3
MSQKSKGGYNKQKLIFLLIAIIIPLVLFFNFHEAKNRLIKDKVLEKNIKRKLKEKGYKGKITKSNLEEVTILFVKRSEDVMSLEGIENLSNLSSLYIYNAKKIKNFEMLASLTKLDSLDIFHVDLDKFLEVEEFPALTELDIHVINYTSNMHFKGDQFPELRVLELQNVDLKDLSIIKDLDSIEELKLNHDNIDSLDGIENLINLKKLEISNATIDDIHKIENLKSLEEIEVFQSEVNNIEVFEKLPNVKIKYKNKKTGELWKP